jgi:hypothetical protein
MDSHKVIGNAPWLTEDGIDLARFPIDAILAQSLERDENSFRSAVGGLATPLPPRGGLTPWWQAGTVGARYGWGGV